MNDLKPYEQVLKDRLSEIPLSDIDIAWANMEAMLEEDKRDPLVIPFWKKWGCMTALLTMGILLSSGWMLYQWLGPANSIPLNEQAEEQNPGTPKEQPEELNVIKQDTTVYQKKQPVDPLTGGSVPYNSFGIDTSFARSRNPQNARGIAPSNSSASAGTLLNTVIFTPAPHANRGATFNQKSKTTLLVNIPKAEPSKERKANYKQVQNDSFKKRDEYKKANDILLNKPTGSIPPVDEGIGAEDTLAQAIGQVGIVEQPKYNKDIHKTEDSQNKLLAKADSIAPNKTAQQVKEPENKLLKWSYSAGLSVYQQIPVNGESSIPFNYYGRKGAITDYIPSAYFRVHRGKLWFLHGELRYGAPQYIKEFIYKSVIKDTAIGGSVTRADYSLRKTYYHQLPISFHYLIRPGLSIGTGVVVNRFFGAISNENTVRRVAGLDSLLSSQTVNDQNDTSFRKTNLQWSAEMQYQWKRGTLGLRYSRDLEPYILYRDFLNGPLLGKKAQSFNIFIRYQLWRRPRP